LILEAHVAGSLLKSIMAAFLVAGVAAAIMPAPAEAQSTSSGKKAKPLKGKSYYGRRGGYSVRKSDVIGDTRRQDPTMNARTSGAPLMSDFFWEQPGPQIGGNTSYMH
jgi:hypothetical protein